jgi:hypothetical protein
MAGQAGSRTCWLLVLFRCERVAGTAELSGPLGKAAATRAQSDSAYFVRSEHESALGRPLAVMLKQERMDSARLNL